jgi:hypothetical protein
MLGLNIYWNRIPVLLKLTFGGRNHLITRAEDRRAELH